VEPLDAIGHGTPVEKHWTRELQHSHAASYDVSYSWTVTVLCQ